MENISFCIQQTVGILAHLINQAPLSATISTPF